jgi:antitoxin YefM
MPTSDGVLGKTEGGEPFIVPLAIPALAGPSALATVLLFSRETMGEVMLHVAALASVAVVRLALFLGAERLQKALGPQVMTAFGCGHCQIGVPLTCATYCTSPPMEHRMRIINFSDARNSLRAVLDQVVEDADVTVIARRDAPDAVVMSFDHYSSLIETVYLLSSPANAAHLAKSIEQLRAGRSRPRDLIEVSDAGAQENAKHELHG